MTRITDPSLQEDYFRIRWRRFESWNEQAIEHFNVTDFDTSFILNWIALNSLYSVHHETDASEYRELNVLIPFLKKVCSLDANREIYDVFWTTYSDSIRGLVDSWYVYPKYWANEGGDPSAIDWQDQHEKTRLWIQRAIVRPENIDRVLVHVIRLLYVLRNQLVHGSATYGGSLNRSQVTLSAKLLHNLVPIVGRIFNANSKEDWGKPQYLPQD